jgi:hypothetical protein
VGYTTDFTGEFRFEGAVPAETILRLMDLAGEDGNDLPGDWPDDGYCQWVLTKDRGGLRWDGNEKFYDYVEWLEAIIANVLKPAGIGLTGTVGYQGEEIGDSGVLIAEGDTVRKVERQLVGETLEELLAFKAWVLENDRDGLVGRWERERARRAAKTA